MLLKMEALLKYRVPKVLSSTGRARLNGVVKLVRKRERMQATKIPLLPTMECPITKPDHISILAQCYESVSQEKISSIQQILMTTTLRGHQHNKRASETSFQYTQIMT